MMFQLYTRYFAIVALLLVVAATGCDSDQSDPGEAEDTPQIPPLNFDVDPGVTPDVETLDGDRELVSIIDNHGVRLDFVANELLFMGDDDALDAFVDRWDATVVDTMALSELDADADPISRVIVNPADGNPDELIDLIRDHDERAHGDFDATSEETLALLSIAAMEAANEDNAVSINPYMPSQQDGYIERELQQAKEGDDDLSNWVDSNGNQVDDYSRNPFDWIHYNAESTQGIGVTEAWRALALAGLTDPADPNDRIRIMVLDGGFLDHDLPEGSFGETLGESNFGDCGSGNECPWHGIAVTQVAVGVPDNKRGVAGTGGPVGNATMVGVSGDLGTSIGGNLQGLGKLIDDVESGHDNPPRIINMSFGGAIHYDLAFGLMPIIESTFNAIDRSDILLIAAAGNQAMDLDQQTCVSVPLTDIEQCWDTYWYWPCEASSVMCIGGLETDGIDKYVHSSTSGSNYGSRVDLWAPYENYMGFSATDGDPSQLPIDKEDEYAHSSTGTSYSSPYVAGVAALIMAADPSLSGSEVQDLLESTAAPGTGDVDRYIQAADAVFEALGGAPFNEFDLDSPDAGDSFFSGERIRLEADLEAGPDLPVDIEWRLDDEIVDSGTSGNIWGDATRDLEPGEYEITATASSGPYELTRSVDIQIVHNPPHVSIWSPNDDQTYFESSTVFLETDSWSESEPYLYPTAPPLSSGQITWYAQPAGHEIATGHSATVSGHEIGVGTTSVTVVGDDGLASATDEISLFVEEDPDVVPPDVVIETPAHNSFHDYDGVDDGTQNFSAEIEFEGSALDPEEGQLTGDALQWRSRRADQSNASFEELGEGESFTGVIWRPITCCPIPYEIELTATNSEGASRSTTIELSIAGYPP